jgi:hypothetical protein
VEKGPRGPEKVSKLSIQNVIIFVFYVDLSIQVFFENFEHEAFAAVNRPVRENLRSTLRKKSFFKDYSIGFKM